MLIVVFFLHTTSFWLLGLLLSQNVVFPMAYPPPQQQPVMMAPGAVQYVSGQQQPTVQFIPAAPQAPQTVSWNYV